MRNKLRFQVRQVGRDMLEVRNTDGENNASCFNYFAIVKLELKSLRHTLETNQELVFKLRY